MPDKPPPNLTAMDGDPGAALVADLDQTPWRRLAEATTVEEYCRSWLELQCRMIGGVTGGVVVLERAEGEALAPVAFWPRGAWDRKRLTGVVERSLSEKKGVLLRSDTGTEPDPSHELRFHLAFPTLVGDRLHGVAAVEITPRPPLQLQSAMRQLQWGIGWLQNWILRQVAAPEAHLRQRLILPLEMAALVLEEERFQAAATSFVTELATRLGCDRASVGFMRGKQVKVHALSHSAQFGKQMNIIRSISMAMSESLDQQALLVYPEPEGKSPHVLHAHEQLVRIHDDRAVCTIPFVDHEGRAFGAITLERSAAEPFDEKTQEVCDSVAALVGPILEEKRKNDRLLITKAGDSAWTQIKRLIGPRYAVRKLVAGGVLLLAVFLAFAKGDYRVTARTILEGEVQRAVVAPYQGFIFEAPARAGDIVRQGDVMCHLDDRDLKLEHRKWTGEREQYLLEHRRAMADGEVAAMNVLGKRIRQAEAQIALLDEQIARARIVAPFDGVVVSGDLSQSLGAPVDVGDLLFEVAPLDSYRLMLQVDERDISRIEVGQRGELILTSFPQTRQFFTVSKITPVSENEEGRNFFNVEATLDEVSERLRPGMEGFGKIEIDRRRLIWIWTHDLIDWVRLWAWSWWP